MPWSCNDENEAGLADHFVEQRIWNQIRANEMQLSQANFGIHRKSAVRLTRRGRRCAAGEKQGGKNDAAREAREPARHNKTVSSENIGRPIEGRHDRFDRPRVPQPNLRTNGKIV